ncbi:hypothetical protein [Roseovarius sp. D22-M7]|uniref:hypothetical protein n=1 Tax=Roseovarius sp. D22-M7 TaxID=3127116 RepID=UPI00300FB70E
MIKSMSVSGAAGLLLGLGLIFWLDSAVAPGGETLAREGKAAIVVICTAVCTVLGAVLRHFMGSSSD